jgi:hypothetical protein
MILSIYLYFLGDKSLKNMKKKKNYQDPNSWTWLEKVTPSRTEKTPIQDLVGKSDTLSP